MRLRTVATRTLFTIGGILLVIILLAVLLVVRANYNEGASKKLLGQTLDHLPIAPTCNEKSRSYNSGSVDTRSGWKAEYGCKTTGGDAYDSITKELTKQGFRSDAFLDYTAPSLNGNSIYYSFQYSNGKVKVEYRFSPMEFIPASNPEALRKTPVTDIRVVVERVFK